MSQFSLQVDIRRLYLLLVTKFSTPLNYMHLYAESKKTINEKQHQTNVNKADMY